MLNALTHAADRFRREGVILPLGYKPVQHPTWVVDIRGDSIQLDGPYRAGTARSFARPDRQRSGAPTRRNMKPFLLCDDARYALGKPEPGKEEVAELVHEGFVTLLRQAYAVTELPMLDCVLRCLDAPEMDSIRKRVGPKETFTFRVDGGYPLRHPAPEVLGEPRPGRSGRLRGAAVRNMREAGAYDEDDATRGRHPPPEMSGGLVQQTCIRVVREEADGERADVPRLRHEIR